MNMEDPSLMITTATITDNHWHSVVRSINDHIDDLAFSFSRYLKSNTPLHAMRVRPCKDI